MRKKSYFLFISLIALAIFPSCAWLATHPEIEVEAAQVGIEALTDIYEYETRTLSPTPPQPNEIQPMKQVPHAP